MKTLSLGRNDFGRKCWGAKLLGPGAKRLGVKNRGETTSGITARSGEGGLVTTVRKAGLFRAYPNYGSVIFTNPSYAHFISF